MMHGAQNFLHTVGARRFFEYWDRLPKTDLLPDRGSFNPGVIADLMPAVTILEVWSRERIDIRLSGTAVCKTMGFDPTGRNGLDLVAPEARDSYLRLIEEQISRPCGRRNVLRSRHASGLIMRTEVVTLPMRHARTGHSMILSFFSALDVVGIGEGGYAILSYEETQWLDIGAGVPDWS
jgi:hypothetical protein